MKRLEDHRNVIDELYKRVAETPEPMTYEQAMVFQLCIIGTALVDISKSLAIIADKAESEEKE